MRGRRAGSIVVAAAIAAGPGYGVLEAEAVR